MEAFTQLNGLVAPMDRANVDTDLIIPKQFLKSIRRSGFGPNLFDSLRYQDEGAPGMDNSSRPINPEFPLNHERYAGASVLLTRENFGCGSSREHAPWALLDFGFRCVIAPSFADIFFGNCFKNGILPITQPAAVVEQLFTELYAAPGYSLTVDLESQIIRKPDGGTLSFEVDAFRRQCLLQGLDDIGITLQSAEVIRRFEQQHLAAKPWLAKTLEV